MTRRKHSTARSTNSPPSRPRPTDRRLSQLLALLADHPMVVLSGNRIAGQLDVSRSAVWRWVEQLRALGVRIKGHPTSGYQLERIPDILVPRLVQNRLRSCSLAGRIHHFFKIDSTNAEALRLAAAGERHGTVVLAEQQTAGRGRLGRNWHSEKANGIYLSVILRPPLSPAQAHLLTLAAGLAVCDAVVEATELAVDLRWPNDLLVDGRKFCGILTEMQAEARQIHYVVIGIGINVNHTQFPKDLQGIATSLRLVAGRVYSRLDLVIRLLRHLERRYNQLLNEGAGPLIAAFTAQSSYARDKRVRVSGLREEFTGVTAGLDATGCLRVRRDSDGRTVPVLAADIREA